MLPLSNAALAASASNRRVWGDGLHHIVDPRSGEPTRDIVASWVVAGSAMLADALATAVCFLEADALPPLESEFGATWARVSSAGSAGWSPTFQGELFR